MDAECTTEKRMACCKHHSFGNTDGYIHPLANIVASIRLGVFQQGHEAALSNGDDR